MQREDVSGAPHPRVGVAVFIRKGRKVLMGKRKNISGNGTWGLVGGHLEFGEELKECATREIEEEVGVSISKLQFATVSNVIFEDENTHYVSVFFVCDYLSGKVLNKEPDKLEKWEWFDWDKLPENLYKPVRNLKDKKFDPFSIQPAQADF